MTNGNDIYDFEEENHERLTNEWYKQQGIHLNLLSDGGVKFLLTKLDNDEGYWEFVTQQQAEDGVD